MKKVMFALVASFISGAAVYAQSQPVTPTPSNAAVAVEQEQKVKIKSEELPEAVKKSLEAQEYKGWLINAAYHTASTDTYTVELKNGAETKTIKFNKDGKKVD
jgi:hypothetical protein